MKKPVWGKVAADHIKQFELIIESLGSLLNPGRKVIFSLKKLWLGIGGSSILLFIGEKVDWQTLSHVIN